MHTQQALSAPAIGVRVPGLLPVANIQPGQTFIRQDSPSEVLTPLSAIGAGAKDGEYIWAVVLATNHDSEGYVPGQLLKLRAAMLVRPVAEVRPAQYSLEH